MVGVILIGSQVISFGVILGPCVVSDCPAALRAGRNLVSAQSSFVVGPNKLSSMTSY